MDAVRLFFHRPARSLALGLTVLLASGCMQARLINPPRAQAPTTSIETNDRTPASASLYAGFGIVSGAGKHTGGNVVLHASVGDSGSTPILTGGGVQLHLGLTQGLSSH